MVRLRTTHLAIHEAIHSLQRLSTNVACMRFVIIPRTESESSCLQILQIVFICVLSQAGLHPPEMCDRILCMEDKSREPSVCISQHVNVGRNAKEMENDHFEDSSAIAHPYLSFGLLCSSCAALSREV